MVNRTLLWGAFLIFVLVAPVMGCGNDEKGSGGSIADSMLSPLSPSMPAPEEMALAYEVSYGGERTQWTVAVSRKESMDGTECYTMETAIEGAPERRRLQGTAEVSLRPVIETLWRDQSTVDLIRSQSSVIAFGTLPVDTLKTFSYIGDHGAPFSVGKQWSYEMISKPSMGARMVSTWNVRVTAIEEITVPAGTFRCYRIEHSRLTVNGTAVQNPAVDMIEWWSLEGRFLGPVRIEDRFTYAQAETRALASYAAVSKESEPVRVKAPSDAERLLSGQAWEEFCDSLKAAGRIVLDPSVGVTEQDRAEGYRHLLRLLWVSMNELMENNDPLRPYLTRYPNVPTKIGHDNPDNVYVGGPIRGDQTYRLSGTIGTNVFTSFNVYSGFIGFDPYESLRTVSSLNSEEMMINPDGSFEIILSPEFHAGNWLKLEPDARILVVRKLFGDWRNETEGMLRIENLTAPGTPAAPLDAGTVARQLDDLARFVESVASFFVGAHYAKFTSGEIPPNTIPPPRVGEMAMADPYNRTQWGHFKLAPDEALIVEFPATDCLYTNFQLGNMWWESLDYRTRQSHLNGFMSYLNADGIYRYVVCPRDPGVPNWLDTEGHLEGTMFLRWTYCQQAPESIVTRVVKFDEIWEYMPPDTPRITAAERAEVLAARQMTVDRRFRP